MTNNNKWILTDPDSHQYRKDISVLGENAAFQLIEVVEWPNGWMVISARVDIDELAETDRGALVSVLSSFGYCEEDEELGDVITSMERTYGEDTLGIVAECWFECLALFQLDWNRVFATEKEAVQFVEDYIAKS